MSWEKVFESNPKAEEIYVVDGMPFINKRHADSHAIKTKKPVELVKRTAKKAKAASDGLIENDELGLENTEEVPASKPGKKGKASK